MATAVPQRQPHERAPGVRVRLPGRRLPRPHLLAAALLLAGTPVSAEPLPLEYFTVDDTISSLRISPEGDFLAATANVSGTSTLLFFELNGMQSVGGARAREGGLAHYSSADPTGGNADFRPIPPGETLTYRFTATRAGVWMYHCSTMPMTAHIANGMFGAVVIEPPDLPEVDRSYVLVQSELYLGEQGGVVDVDKVQAEQPDAVVFDIGNVLIRWDPQPAVAAAVGDDEATRFLEAADFDFGAWNHAQDAGRPWSEAEADATRSHPHWREHILAYRTHFADEVVVVADAAILALGLVLLAFTWQAGILRPRANRACTRSPEP